MYTKPKKISALDAKSEALKIAFAPVVFQVTFCLWKLGVLELLGERGDDGLPPETIAEQLHISLYGVKVLCDVGLSAGLLWINGDNYVLDKIGHFVLTDSMVQVNFDFIQDVCYQGLFSLIDSIKQGKPEGLKVFGDWKTIYPAISVLPEPAKSSWFAFDHYYSDKAFEEILPIVFKKPVKHLFDIGGNTGKFATRCFEYDDEVNVTIIDLPEQIDVVTKIMNAEGYSTRFEGFPIDLLNPNATLPTGADVIWMSQFLDCFSEEEIFSILKRVASVMTPNTRLYILELFWDRQIFEAAAFSMNCISIYFTAMANGNSRMYHSKDLIKLIHKAGLVIAEDIDQIGSGHTLLGVRRAV